MCASYVQASLTYDPDAELLHGTANGKKISINAASGGFRGTTNKKKKRIPQHISMNSKNSKAVIPSGTYKIFWLGRYKKFGECCFLHPDANTKQFCQNNGRKWNDFLIHGPGPVGSEGCIVPYAKGDYRSLMATLRARKNQEIGLLVVGQVKVLYMEPMVIRVHPE